MKVYALMDNDESIRALVNCLAGLPGIETIGSCGGHDNPQPGQHAAGSWFVSFYAVGMAGQFWLSKVEAIVAEIDDVSIYHDEHGWHSIDGGDGAPDEVVIDAINLAVGPWVAGPVMCTHCKTEHMSVHPEVCKTIQCPHCDKMTAVNADVEIWEANHDVDESVH